MACIFHKNNYLDIFKLQILFIVSQGLRKRKIREVILVANFCCCSCAIGQESPMRGKTQVTIFSPTWCDWGFNYVVLQHICKHILTNIAEKIIIYFSMYHAELKFWKFSMLLIQLKYVQKNGDDSLLDEMICNVLS